MQNYARIPAEMRPYRQWIVWRYEDRGGSKPTKIPYDPKTGQPASVDNPNTWADFDTAVAVAQNGQFAGLGFVLTEHDPFVFIDLDAAPNDEILQRQYRVFNEFKTYAERSPSGNGCHLIGKGHVPRGRKRHAVEVYSSLRYMTMTGDAINDMPIANVHELANLLWGELGKDSKGNPVAIDAPQTEDDNTVVQRAMNAANGVKFTDLLNGRWQEHYPPTQGGSQSEADFALIDMIAFYTQNREQIARIFYASALGQRDKATKRKDYVPDMIEKSFDRILPPQDFELFKINAANIIAAMNDGWTTNTTTATLGAEHQGAVVGGGIVPVGPPPATVSDVPHAPEGVNNLPPPPGLMGLIADYIYRSAPRPVPEIALAGAIGMMAGIAGRTYQTPTGVALNLYTLLIAKSGRGKEAMAQGIWRIIMAAARITRKPNDDSSVPAITTFIGPTDFRSDAALTKELSTRPCFVSIMGEFGLKMQAMVAPNVSSHLLGLRAVYLDLYHKADRSSQLSEMVYSDKDKNTKAVYRPSFSILAETTPSTYYEALSETLIMQGLLSRFLTIEYPGPRPDLNTYNVEPSMELVQSIASLATQCLTYQQKNLVLAVEFNKDADELQRNYNRHVDQHINSSDQDAYAELWNRAHLKALKLASLVAVGVNPHHPVVDATAWQWAQTMVDRDVENTVNKFATGQVGKIGGNDEQNRDLTDAIIDWITLPYARVKSYCPVKEGEAMHADHVIPHGYLTSRTQGYASFKNDKAGHSRALYNAIRSFTTSGLLVETKANQLKDSWTNQIKYTGTGVVYTIADETAFRNRAQGRKRRL